MLQYAVFLKRNYCLLLSILIFVTLQSNGVVGTRDDDDDEDPYTTTDPKKREPSPCESTIVYCQTFLYFVCR